MNIAILSDIHSNYTALKTCIEHALNRGIIHFIFLGDYVSDCPYPQKTMNLLYELQDKYQCWFIRGNREEYMLDHRKAGEKGWYYSSCCGCLQYTYENLTKHDLDFFEGFDNKGELQIAEYPSISFCHGSLTSTRELLEKDKENTIAVMRNLDTDLLLCGHTHVQGTFKYGNKKLINPGSVGVPWFYGGRTQYAILHGKYGTWEEEYIQLDYNVEKVLEEYRECGLDWKAPMWTVLTQEVLRTGKDRTMSVLIRATELCKTETGKADWPDIPDKYWEQAADEIGIT